MSEFCIWKNAKRKKTTQIPKKSRKNTSFRGVLPHRTLELQWSIGASSNPHAASFSSTITLEAITQIKKLRTCQTLEQVNGMVETRKVTRTYLGVWSYSNKIKESQAKTKNNLTGNLCWLILGQVKKALICVDTAKDNWWNTWQYCRHHKQAARKACKSRIKNSALTSTPKQKQEF